MSITYAYNFAYIDPVTNMCIEVFTCTDPNEGNRDDVIVVQLDVYDPEYGCKYYINGNWYVDAEGTIPWQSSLI